MRLLALALSLSCLTPPVQAQITHSSGIPQGDPTWGQPDFGSSPLASCPWPETRDTTGPRVSLRVAEGTLVLPAKSRFPARPTKQTETGTLWTGARGSWLTVERGPTSAFNGTFGAWFYIVGQVLPPGVTVGCSDCLGITTRCHEFRDGRNLYVAWGQYDGGWDNYDYEVLAAFEIGSGEWLVLRGGGPKREMIDRILTAVKSVAL
jgi:hypothetical protein